MTIIHTIRAFQDNYIWLFHAENSTSAYVVDPGDAAPVERALAEFQLNLAGILITHHHYDHTGGVAQLVANHKNVFVYGPASTNFKPLDKKLNEGDSIEIADLSFEIFEVGGHTLDHIAYFAQPTNEAPLLFCGDTLFTGGCGRVFEGTPNQMYQSLQKLSKLPPNTRVFCAHEYTQSNLKFAQAVEPTNQTLLNRYIETAKAREIDQTTVPSVLAQELATNPFLRCAENDVKKSAEQHTGYSLKEPAEVFRVIRAWKDNF